LTDAQITPAPKDSASQAYVAFTIVLCATVIALGCIVLAYEDKTMGPSALTIAGAVVGGLLTALQAPSGIGSVISSALGKKPLETP
jgi:FtsH-binding integral membrane protein